MKKRFLSLLCVLALCLGLLPVTAEAAEGAPSSLYVGNQQVISSSDITYWTTDESTGGLTKYEGNNDNWNVKYDQSTATLTLKNANISGSFHQYDNPYTAGIYAQGKSNQPVALTIELIGTNTITGTYGIFLNAEINAYSYGTNATLTITGENNGSLGVSGSGHGIYVKSGTGNASLNIKNVAVTSSTNGNYAAGVYVMSSAHATNSPNISLAVDGGNLTASGTGSSDGIWFYVGSSQATGATTSLTVSENAIVDARNGGISALKILETLPTPTPTGDNRSGIVFDGSTGTVYGTVALQNELTIGAGETLTVPDGSTLDTSGKLTNNGTIINKGTLTGSITGKPAESVAQITVHPENVTVTEGATAEFSVTATGENLSYQWQQSTASGQNWTNIEGAIGATYTTGATTLAMNNYQYQCVVSNSAGSVTSDVATLTVKEHVHTWGNPIWNWSEDGKTCTVTFTCEKDENHKENPVVTVTSAIKSPATCTEKGVTTYTATVEFDGKTYTDTKEVADIPATGHSYGKPVWNWSEDGKTCTVTFTCEKDETHKETPKVIVTSAEKTPGTCTEAGVTTYTATVEFNGQTYTDTKDVADIPATGHSYDNGKCTVCGAIASDFKVIITAGANGSWQKGTKDGLTFTSNAAYKHFQKVQVDGKDLDASNYTVKEGSTIVTLKTSYLETLSVGKHTLAIVSETGTATTEFTIKAAASANDRNPANPNGEATESVQTGDNTNMMLWIVMLFVSASILGIAVYEKRKKHMEN